MPQVSREYRIYLALWRKAYSQDEVLNIKVPNLSMAVAMRQGMYRAIRPFREGKFNDEELTKAADRFVVYLVKGKSASDVHFIEFRPRQTLALLESSFDTLGLDEEDLQFGEERDVHEELKTLLNDAEERRATPFFTR